MNIDRDKFFRAFKVTFGALNQKQVDALEALLHAIEGDEQIEDLRHVAYILATIKHETAHTFEPIEEYGKGRGKKYGIPDPQTKQTYYGRGYVQLTWKRNYKLLGQRLDVDLVNNPELALEPETAWAITSEGMRYGLFTGKDLDDFINEQRTDYVNARKIINGLDKAEVIANYARRFETILKASTASDDDIQQAGAPGEVALTPSPKEEEEPQGTTEAKLSIKDGNIEMSTTENPPKAETVLIEKPAPKGFLASIKKKIGAAFGANVTVQGVREIAEPAQALGLSPRFWVWISIFVAVGALIWLAIEFYKHYEETKRDLELTKTLVNANVSPSNTVGFASKEDATRMAKAEGVKMVPR